MYRGKQRKYVIAAVVLSGVFLLIAATYPSLGQLDTVIGDWIRGWQTNELTAFFIVVTRLGGSVVEYAIMFVVAAFLIAAKKYWQALVGIVCLAGGWGLNTFLKSVYERDRPELEHLAGFDYFSFPSGHAMVSACFYGFLGYVWWLSEKKTNGFMIFTLTGLLIFLIGISRIYLGVHFPTDVLAGFAAGGAWLFVCIIILNQLLKE